MMILGLLLSSALAVDSEPDAEWGWSSDGGGGGCSTDYCWQSNALDLFQCNNLKYAIEAGGGYHCLQYFYNAPCHTNANGCTVATDPPGSECTVLCWPFVIGLQVEFLDVLTSFWSAVN